jgi:NADP-dependent 3-hydroxy acid dehydrogenase YdfG
LDAAAKEIGDGALAIQSDAGKVAEIEAAMKKIKERFGRIDALFVNAGVAKLVPFDQVTEAIFDESCSTHRLTRSWACRELRSMARPKRP